MTDWEKEELIRLYGEPQSDESIEAWQEEK